MNALFEHFLWLESQREVVKSPLSFRRINAFYSRMRLLCNRR